MAAAERIRSLLRVPRRRDEQLASGSHRGQSLHRSAVFGEGRIPSLEGSGGSGAQNAPRSAQLEPIQALVHVVLPRRQSRAAPLAQGLRRQVQGQIRRRLRSVPEWVLQRMIDKGIMPKDTRLTPINPMPEDVANTAPADAVRPWDTLNDDEKRLFSRMAEVCAGFSEYT